MRHVGDDFQWGDAALSLSKTPLEAVAIAAEHVHDGNGRCRGCVRAKFGRRFDAWPCPLADMAKAALTMHQAATSVDAGEGSGSGAS